MNPPPPWTKSEANVFVLRNITHRTPVMQDGETKLCFIDAHRKVNYLSLMQRGRQNWP